ncbi:carbohydrate ABC transporter permease [Cohnella kolymensis]|uniref:carbohydrate ABC transporter permease n=1 Tax=Cohnella kolymensis TaxID=1590652 RepID=UPI000A751A2E|nr:sugar ABC transporter permease [Cohnella kolymensis]
MLSKLNRNRLRFAYLMIIPGFMLMAVFVFYPILYGLPLAFTNYSVVDEMKWVGWKNFDRAFKDPIFIKSIWNSLIYLIVVPIIQLISILMAILVNNRLRGVQFFRVAYFVPVVTSMVAAAIAWRWMFQGNGILNYLLQSAGLIGKPISYLAEADVALFAIMCVTVWKGLGYYMMIYLAGLQSIPSEMQEAARIDGAGRAKVIWYITIPLLKPFVLLCSLISMMSAIRVFDEVYVMTAPLPGAPFNATMTSAVYTYEKAFRDFDFGYAAALGLIVSLIVMVISIIMFKYGRKGGMSYYG